MKLLWTFFMAFIWSLNIQAQTIVAGEHGPDDYYFDIDPDTTIYIPNYYLFTYPIDINGDSILDLEIGGYCGIAPGTTVSQWHVTGYSDTQVAFGYTDSCIANNFVFPSSIAYAFELGEPINSQAIWSDNEHVLAFYYSFSNPDTVCTGTNFPGPNPLYIGVKVLRESDFQYGWIQVVNVSPYEITIQGYACNDYAVGFYNELRSDWFTIYPNPVHNQLFIYVSDVEVNNSISIFNILGEKVLGINMEAREAKLDISSLQSGVYFVRLQRGNHFSLRKVIKY